MSTTTRPELSKKNKYWIEKHRYYELKHFCLQYPIWRKALRSIDSLAQRPIDVVIFSGEMSDPTERAVMLRAYYDERMRLVESCTNEADSVIGPYILKAVTESLSYETLNARLGVPCCKESYYELYRRFFWLLSKARK